MRLRARRVQVRALKRTAAFPARVLGPVECWAFCRLAACCLSEITILHFSLGAWGLSAHTRFNDTGRVMGNRYTKEGGQLVSGLVGEGCGGEFFFPAC